MKTFYALYLKDNELDHNTRLIGKFESLEMARRHGEFYFRSLGKMSIHEGLFQNQWIITRELSLKNLGLIQEENH